MTENTDWTCGKGLAASADLPAALADLLAARGEVLERHTRALDANDPKGKTELDAYMRLAGLHREVAAALRGLAEAMASYRDMPMAPHDMAVMMGPKGQAEAFARFVDLERGLVEMLAARLKQDEAMLGAG